MGFIWDVLKDVTKTVINVHSLGAVDVEIIGNDDENSFSGRSESAPSEYGTQRDAQAQPPSSPSWEPAVPQDFVPFDSSKFPSEAELSEVATRLCSVRPEYKWSSGPDPEDHTICAVDLFGRVLISGERRKCHLSGATDYYGGILIHSVEVFPTWSDPFERAIEANVYLASVTGHVIMGIGNGGRPRESTWFRAKCRRGQTGFTTEKLDVLHQLVSHFVPRLSNFYAECEIKRNGGNGIMALVQAELNNVPIQDWLLQLNK